jgi:hypothetical protein
VVNNYDVRVVKVLGDFTCHSHPETDEFFLVLSGSLATAMDDDEVVLKAGDIYVVPRGRRHQPHADRETALLLVDPSATVNTADAPGALTAPRTLSEPGRTALSTVAASGESIAVEQPGRKATSADRPPTLDR